MTSACRSNLTLLRWAALPLVCCGGLATCGGDPILDGDDATASRSAALFEAPLLEDCTKYPFSAATLLAERAGFGAATTGGDPTRVFHVKSLADSGSGTLREAAGSSEPYYVVFDVEGTIKLASRMDVKSNKTIDGRGRAITIDGTLRLPSGTTNVILSDITIVNPAGFATSDGDTIEVRGKGGRAAR
jgi:pectate lyase